MPLVMGITLPAGIEIIYNKQIKMYDISVLCRVGKNPQFFPRKKFYDLKEITYLYQIAYAWNAFSDELKDEWKYAANITGQHGYNLYVQDKSYRLKHAIGGDATPHLYHQYTVGHLKIESPASAARIVQYNYDSIGFPSFFETCFKSNLTADGGDPYARLKLRYTRYYLGKNIVSDQSIYFPLVSGWDKRNKQVIPYDGAKGKWSIRFELNDVVGDFWFDNIIVEYGGEIRTVDPFCLDVYPKWRKLFLPEGATFETIYPTGGAL